jgi:hypothetical protein
VSCSKEHNSISKKHLYGPDITFEEVDVSNCMELVEVDQAGSLLP